MSEKTLVIVESPAKAKTISKYLGADYLVESSVGHIRDLPSSAAEVPDEYREEPWARLGVNIEDEFKPVYVVPKSKKSQVTKLKKALKEASALYLATDEDREGEAIAWHLQEVLKPKVPVRRMVFDEITKSAIVEASRSTRDIDLRLVNAQEARRILDRLYGYEVSPVLWRKVGPKLSAGRVQSVATRLVVDRERERMRFIVSDYWDIEARLKTEDKKGKLLTRLVELGGQRIAIGKDFEDTTGKLKPDAKVVLLNRAGAQEVAESIEAGEIRVSSIVEKPFASRPAPPFITSTLQQEAGRKLRYGAQRTMRLAQRLYENGYITYMRTDSTNLSNQAVNAARSQVLDLYGDEYLPPKPRTYASKAKNAQEAHEAIRPAGESFRTPQDVRDELESDAWKLYELIWKRTVACQMKNAEGLRTTVRVSADGGTRGEAILTVSGKVIQFAGFLRAYVEGSDDPEAELEDKETILPAVREGETLQAEEVTPLSHSTQPPARYTEASLIRELEERGIGRPSTYASILQTIQDRGYVWRKGTALVPSFTAFAVVNLMERHLYGLVDYNFTARMEDDLDEIAGGSRDATPWLHDFYFGEPGEHAKGDMNVTDVGLKALLSTGQDDIDPRAISAIPIGETENGEPVVVRVGRYGPYVQVGDSDLKASIPDEIAPDELSIDRIMEMLDEAAQGDKVLGEDPETGKPIYIKTGRFGPYVQLGDPELTPKGNIKKGSKPKMASLWPSMSIETVSLEDAVMLLSFPREVGRHPETGQIITAQDGRYGPYLKMANESRSLTNHEQLSAVTLEEAVELFKQPKGGRRKAEVVKDLGTVPGSEEPVQVKTGRYGPYVTDGVVNATIPKDKDPASLTLEEGLELIRVREEKMKEQGKDPRAKAKKKKSKKASSSTEKSASTTKKKKAKTTKLEQVYEELGPPPEGFAWTRTGKPVVETWPEDTLNCPNCSSAMQLKAGRFGPFFSCTNYPGCKTSINLRGEAKKRAEQEVEAPPRFEPIPTDVACTECDGKMVIRKSRGKPFLGCGKYPECKATQPMTPELEHLLPKEE